MDEVQQVAPVTKQQTAAVVPWKKYALYAGIGLLFLDLLLVNGLLVFGRSEKKTTDSLQLLPTPAVQTSPSFSGQLGVISDQINQATETVKLQLLTILSGTPSPTPTSIPTGTPTPVQTREYFVPLGSGSGTATDWTTLTQIGAKIDPLNYGAIQSITFEANVRIPTGNQTVWLRLYNANTFQSVSGSDVSLSGGTPTILVSSPITLGTGNNLYQVQLKTQLGYTTNIDFARLRIKAQ